MSSPSAYTDWEKFMVKNINIILSNITTIWLCLSVETRIKRMLMFKDCNLKDDIRYQHIQTVDNLKDDH